MDNWTKVVFYNEGDAGHVPGSSPGVGKTFLNGIQDFIISFVSAFNSHKDRHAIGGDDEITPEDIGAVSSDDFDTLESNLINEKTILTTSGTSPAYTIADSTVTSYITGLRRTIKFHADGDTATLNFNGVGSKSLFEYTGKAANVKAGQIRQVYYDGTNFFIISGGGAIVPSTITAGNTVIYAKLGSSASNTLAGYYDVGAGWGYKALVAGTYKFTYGIANVGNYNAVGGRLTKNGTEVSGSVLPSVHVNDVPQYTEKTIDIALNANDVIKMQVTVDNPSNTYVLATQFIVSISATTLQSELNYIGIAST